MNQHNYKIVMLIGSEMPSSYHDIVLVGLEIPIPSVHIMQMYQTQCLNRLESVPEAVLGKHPKMFAIGRNEDRPLYHTKPDLFFLLFSCTKRLCVSPIELGVDLAA